MGSLIYYQQIIEWNCRKLQFRSVRKIFLGFMKFVFINIVTHIPLLYYAGRHFCFICWHSHLKAIIFIGGPLNDHLWILSSFSLVIVYKKTSTNIQFLSFSYCLRMDSVPQRASSFCLFFFFDDTGTWSQCLTLARQVLNHLSHSPPVFCVGYFLFFFNLINF
jgi:hypothetical protein